MKSVRAGLRDGMVVSMYRAFGLDPTGVCTLLNKLLEMCGKEIANSIKQDLLP